MMRTSAGWSGYHVDLRHHRPDPDGAPVTELVVALDGSAYAERSVEAADALAAAADVPLRLVTVRPDLADRRSTQTYLARIARRAPRGSDADVVESDDVAGALLDRVEDDALLVLATHARHLMGEILFGSVADRVLSRRDVPVLLVGPAAGVPDPAFSTIVVPDDGGSRSRVLRPHVIAWSEHLAATPVAVQALPVARLGPDLAVLESAHLRRVARELGPSAGWEAVHGRDAASAIVEFATGHDAGMIAMVVPARGRIGPDAGGGVALQIVRHAPCPVLAMSPRVRS